MTPAHGYDFRFLFTLVSCLLSVEIIKMLCLGLLSCTAILLVSLLLKLYVTAELLLTSDILISNIMNYWCSHVITLTRVSGQGPE